MFETTVSSPVCSFCCMEWSVVILKLLILNHKTFFRCFWLKLHCKTRNLNPANSAVSVEKTSFWDVFAQRGVTISRRPERWSPCVSYVDVLLVVTFSNTLSRSRNQIHPRFPSHSRNVTEKCLLWCFFQSVWSRPAILKRGSTKSFSSSLVHTEDIWSQHFDLLCLDLFDGCGSLTQTANIQMFPVVGERLICWLYGSRRCSSFSCDTDDLSTCWSHTQQTGGGTSSATRLSRHRNTIHRCCPHCKHLVTL